MRFSTMYRVIILSFLALNVTACATMTRGTTEDFYVNTVPTGVNVETTNGFHCITPCSLKMKRNAEFAVTLSKEGYQTITENISNKVSGEAGATMAGNVLVGGLVGAAIDAGSGAMKDLTPNPLDITMTPTSAADPTLHHEDKDEAMTITTPDGDYRPYGSSH